MKRKEDSWDRTIRRESCRAERRRGSSHHAGKAKSVTVNQTGSDL